MYYSQEWTAQDKFVAETLEFKKDGTVTFYKELPYKI